MSPGAVTQEPRLKARRSRAFEVAAAADAGVLVAADPSTIRWLTGGGDARCVVVAHGELRAPGLGELAAALQDAGAGPDDVVAVEAAGLPLTFAQELGPRPTRDVGRPLARARACKDAPEIELTRRAAAVASAGQHAVRAAAEEGISEIDVWSSAVAEMQRLAGAPVAAGVDLMAGERTALVGEPPGPTVLAEDDLVLVDIAPRVDNYWGDSCSAFSTGHPTAEQRRMHDACARALDAGIAAAKPGAVARDLDAVVRGVMADAGYSYDHHSGHGVGLAAQEEPWITPSSDTVLAEGMTLALEPGTYTAGGGVRLEHVLLVGPDGAEILTTHSLSLIREEAPR